MRTVVFSLAALVGAAQDSKTLISFPGVRWIENDDPIMGGQSKGKWTVHADYATFQGSTKLIPSLNAPGFCRVITLARFRRDASEYADGGLKLTVRSNTTEYKGFILAFGDPKTPKHHNGHELQGAFKAKFVAPADAATQWKDVFIPFTDFSWDWSDFTGDCATKDSDGFQHQCCTPQNTSYCPSADRLKGITSFNIWAEGVEGDFHLDIKEIAATTAPLSLMV